MSILNFYQLIGSQPLRTIFAWVRSCFSPKREYLFGKKRGHMTKTAAESIRSIGRATRSANLKIRSIITLKFTTTSPILPKNCMFQKLRETQNSLKNQTAYPLQSGNDAIALSKTLFNAWKLIRAFEGIGPVSSIFGFKHESRQSVYLQFFCVNFDGFVCAVPKFEFLVSIMKLRNKMPFHLRK